MKQTITAETLINLGINIPEAQLTETLIHLNNLLEERIGAEIASSLTDEELVELTTLQENNDEAAVSAWLSANVPELQDIAQDELNILLDEVAKNEDALN